MRRAEKQEQSYSLIMKERDASAFLVLSMSGKRSKRQLGLYLLCAMAYCYLGLKKIVGIATEPLSAKYRSYDALGLKAVKFEHHDDLAEQAKNFFSKPYRPEFTEYIRKSWRCLTPFAGDRASPEGERRDLFTVGYEQRMFRDHAVPPMMPSLDGNVLLDE